MYECCYIPGVENLRKARDSMLCYDELYVIFFRQPSETPIWECSNNTQEMKHEYCSFMCSWFHWTPFQMDTFQFLIHTLTFGVTTSQKL